MVSIFIIVPVLVLIVAMVWIIYTHKALLKEANLISDKEKKVTTKAEVFKITSQLSAGVAVIAGLFITIGQLVETKNQYEQTIRNQEEQMHQRRESFSLKRFETAILDLESNNASRRTSGILTINLIANDFPDSYKQIADDVLIAFVRDSFSAEFRQITVNSGSIWPPRDRRLALEILSARLGSDVKANTHFIKLDLSGADLPNLVIEDFIFSESNLNGANLSKSKLIRVNLSNSSLIGINFRGADLNNSNFEDADAHSSDFMAATLTDACFIGADLRYSRFTAASMSKASFKNADLSNSSFTGAKMKDVDLRGANLTDVELLSQAILNETIGDKSTILPSTLTPPEHWQ